MKFSIFDSCFAKNPSGEISLEDLVALIRGGTHCALVDQIRATDDPDARSRLKKRLPAITPSGTFSKRSKGDLIAHSGAICADLDLAENPSIREHGAAIRARLKEDPSAFLIFESPSGGLKSFFRVKPNAGNHAASFAAIAQHLKTFHGLKADESGKDVSRLCFLSHDPSAWHRAPGEAKILEPCESPEAYDSSDLIGDPTRPGDIFNADGDLRALLRRHGWNSRDEKNWTRPGKSNGTSATLLDEKVFYVFSSNAPRLEPGRAYSKFALFAALEHGGDFAAAARALAAQGFSKPTWDPLRGRESRSVEAEENAPSESIFADIDAALNGSIERILPDLCEISDGRFLLYRGKINEIHGEPGIGKSNILLTIAAKILMARGRVLLIDPEDNVSTAVSRLLAFGASRDSIREGFRYSNAIEPQNWPEFHKSDADLFIIDGIAEALAAENLNEDVAGDFLHWIHSRIRPFTKGGAAVLLADHVSKNRESRGAWSRGSSAKIGAYDGAVFEICEGRSYSPEIEGFVRLKISKDRAGGVGRKGQEVAQVHFAPGRPATFRTAEEILQQSELEARQRVIEAIRDILESEEIATKSKIIKLARMKAQNAARILDELANENFIEMKAQGAGRATEIKFLV